MHHHANHRGNRSGLRWVERGVVALMLAVMGSIVVPSFSSADDMDGRAQSLASQLSTLRNALRTLRGEATDERYPDLVTQGWTPLIRRGLIPRAPVNPMNGTSLITESPTAGAGWHYDSATGWLGACYFDEGSGTLTPNIP